jgi:hypothetical protein
MIFYPDCFPARPFISSGIQAFITNVTNGFLLVLKNCSILSIRAIRDKKLSSSECLENACR